MKNKIILILLAITTSIGNLVAQKPAVMLNDKTGWHKIASKSVDLEKERDEISVIGADRFASIKVLVKSGEINLSDLEVYFDKGDKQKTGLLGAST